MAKVSHLDTFDMQGGVSFNDRHLAADVRRKVLKYIQKVFESGTKTEQKEMVNKLATNILPRLQEVSGVDGEAIAISISREASDKLEASTKLLDVSSQPKTVEDSSSSAQPL